MNKLIIGLVTIASLACGFTLGRWTAPANLDQDDQESGEEPTDAPHPAAAPRSFGFHLSHRASAPSVRSVEDPSDPTPIKESSHKSHHSEPTIIDILGGSMSSNSAAKWQAKAMSERAKFFASVNLTPEQQRNFDGLLGAMNDALKDRAAYWSDEVRAGKIGQSEMVLRMNTDLSSALVSAYDAMDHAMPPNWRAKADSKFSVMRFVDPSVHTALQGLRPPSSSGKSKKKSAYK